MDKLYILYDSRAIGDTDDATVLDTDESIEVLKESAKDYGGGVIYSYDVNGTELINEKFELIISG